MSFILLDVQKFIKFNSLNQNIIKIKNKKLLNFFLIIYLLQFFKFFPINIFIKEIKVNFHYVIK